MVGGWGDTSGIRTPAIDAPPAINHTGFNPIRWAWLLACVSTVAVALSMLPGLEAIAPLIESDYCYLLIAADRLYDGHGLTSLQPVAPNQPWNWQYDWGFLTQWPAGYPLLIAGIRCVLGGSSIEASRVVSIIGFAAALVGWFAFTHRLVPSGVTALLLATVACTSCLSMGLLVNPSTDLLLIAVLPFLLLLVCEARSSCSAAGRAANLRGIALLGCAGLCAGGLFWFRYASVFVPTAIGLVLLVEWFRKRVSGASLFAFLSASAAPIAALILLNSSLGPATDSIRQFNLGSTITWDFSLSEIIRAWWTLCDFGYYAHKPWAHWILASAPIAVYAVLAVGMVRSRSAACLNRVEVQLSMSLLISLLGMLFCAVGLFGAKFDYIGLERYYLPARPILLALTFSGVMCIPRRVVRAALCLILVTFGSWTLLHDWMPTYSRWNASRQSRAPSGGWSRAFEPGADRVYAWVREQAAKGDLIIFSNFHEYLTMETKVATLPIPPSPEALGDWVHRSRTIRGASAPRVVFALNPDNLWRSYWIPSPEEVKRRFELEPLDNAPIEVRPYLFTVKTDQLDHLTLISWN